MPPLNGAIAAARDASIRNGVDLVGFERGWQGVLEGKTVDLSRATFDPQTGGTVLRSSRVNLVAIPGAPEEAAGNLRRLGVSGLIVIGGEDTLSNAAALEDVPLALISKTIDNDVGEIRTSTGRKPALEFVNYFTLGYPTAARKIASFVSMNEGLRTTAYSHERLIVVESMGMHAGWLALSSSMGRPDFIIVPEFGLDYGRFLEKAAERYRKQKHLIVVVAEGARWKDGSYLSADASEHDDFGHPRFKGSADLLARRMKEDLKSNFDTRNVNSVNPSYLYRSGAPCSLDLAVARKLGARAAAWLAGRCEGHTFLAVRKTATGFGVTKIPLPGAKSIKSFYRTLDERLYSSETYSATDEARRYLSAIVPETKPKAYELN